MTDLARRVSPRPRHSIGFLWISSLLVVSSLLVPVSFPGSLARAGVSWMSRAEAAPDLVPTTLTAPESGVFQAGVFVFGTSVSWTVKNQGTATTAGGWYDYLYLSPTSTCCAGATFLGAVDVPPWLTLATGESYTQLASVAVPNLPIGGYYLILRVNATGNLVEANAANNEFSRPFRIAPALDLYTEELTAPASASTRQAISVSWTVGNAAAYMPEPATASPWQDNLYISPTSTCCAGATLLGSWYHSGGLVFNEHYTQTQSITVPDLPAGTYYLILWADATNVQPESSEDNNQRSVTIKVTTPDLVPTSLAGPGAPASASTQQAISPSWVVKNQGTGATNLPWQDNLYISPSPTCCEGATPLGEWPRTASLAVGASYTQAKTVTVPNLPAGSYYLIVWTNPTGTLHEESAANNQRAIPITIKTPDLAPTALTALASVSTGQAVSMSWTVKNQGTAATIGTWTDNLYLSTTPTCCAGATLLGQWDRSMLAAGGTYTQTKSITMPNLAAGSYYLVVQVDVNDTLYEANEANNQRTLPITITTPDLAPTALTSPASVSTQQAIQVSWTVKNQSAGPTVGTWTDTLYLSPTPTCCTGAISLGQWTRTTTLAAGAVYSQSKTVTVPNVAAGSYSLIVKADAANALYEADEGNNQRATALMVTTPDLTPVLLAAPPSATAGHVASLSWTVKNQGTGPTTGTWTDTVYLSPSPTCCVGATSLGSWTATAVAAQATYKQTKSVTLPTSLATGNYYLIVWTDANRQLYEADESNNQRAAQITVTGTGTTPAAALLAVTAVNGGSNPTAGTGFSVVVEAWDAGGTRRTVASATAVQLSLKVGTGVLGGTLTGTIPAGTGQVTISGTTYPVAEGGVILTATRTSGATLSPGDSAPFTVSPGAIASYAVSLSSPQPAGGAFAVTVTARDPFTNRVTTNSATVVTLHSASGHVVFDANADGVFGDASKPLYTGVLSMNARGTAVETTSIVATDANGKTGSAPLWVNVGAASTLVFTTQPGGALAGNTISGPPTVAVRDGFGNTVASSTASITLAIGTNPGGGALAGTTTTSAIGGGASFADLTISEPGAGYTLTAAAPGLTGATSAPFTITPATGTISGRVTRASDAGALSGATVSALQAGLVKGSATTGADGTYSMTGLTPASYDVRASAASFQPQTQASVAISAGSTASVNFSLTTVPGPTIRITAPAAGSTLNRFTVLVRGEFSVAAGTEVGVTINGLAAEADQGQFGAVVPLQLGSNAITATLTDPAGNTASDTIAVQVPTQQDDPLRLLVAPSSGLSPLSVQFSMSRLAAPAIIRFDLDLEGDGVADLSSSTFTGTVPHTYNREGLFFPTLTATDSSGSRTTAAAIVHVFLLPDLIAKWNGLKDALRQGDIGIALQFIATDSRARYQGIFTALASALPQVDTVLNDIQLVAVRGNTAEFSMPRVDSDGVQRSYYVLFIRDGDGLWRLLTF